jgi:iduronate 2-sulfatase
MSITSHGRNNGKTFGQQISIPRTSYRNLLPLNQMKSVACPDKGTIVNQRRPGIPVLTLFILNVFFFSCCTHGSADDPKMNILLIVCDDLNTHVSTSGYDQIHTPTMDRLAKDGMTFSHAFCQYPVCGPSRASFLHGLYPESTGVLDNRSDIRQTRPGTVSMPELFKRNGYWTASVGKTFHSPRQEHGEIAWHEFHRFENDPLPLIEPARKKFEKEFGSVNQPGNRLRWRKAMTAAIAPLNAQTPPGHGRSGLEDHQHRDGKNARQVANWLKKKSFGNKPFFISLGIQKPHVPFLAPDRYFDLYPREKIGFHRDAPDLWKSIPADALNGRYQAFGFQAGVENVARRQEFMQAYHACISFIDAQIGVVLDQLKAENLYNDTIIILTSDHGYHLGDHFLWGKVTLFDIGTKVPLIVRVPGITKKGSRSDAMIELVDIFPTLTDLSRLNPSKDLQGKSIVPLLQEPTAAHSNPYAYSVVRRKQTLGYAIRDQQWRYGQWPNGEELYDLRTDPHERVNLAHQPNSANKLFEMRKALAVRQELAGSQKEKD